MQIEKEQTIQYVLRLSQAEAAILRGLVQNSTEHPAHESATSAELRRKIFEGLDD